MQRFDVPVKFLRGGRHGLPKYATEESAGMDLYAYIDEPGMCVVLQPGQRRLVFTGMAMAIPTGLELQIRPRSGSALKTGLTVLNSPGTIDSDYRGEIGVILINEGDTEITITDGDRIAQGVLCPVYQANLNVVEALDETTRGAGGFGHTGNN